MKTTLMIQFIFKSGKVTKFTYGKYDNDIPKEKIDKIKEDLIELIVEGINSNNTFIISDIEKKDFLIIKTDSIDQVNVYFDHDKGE